MCSICSQLPTRRIEYHLEGVTRIEAYCDEHFSIYERNKDVDINSIIEAYGCVRAEPGTFGGSKVEKQKEGYSKVAKSSLADRTITCNRCGFRIVFDDSQRGPNGRPIPLDLTGEIHNCGITYSFPCSKCDEQIYLDRKVLSPSGKRIPLNALDGKYHYLYSEGKNR